MVKASAVGEFGLGVIWLHGPDDACGECCRVKGDGFSPAVFTELGDGEARQNIAIHVYLVDQAESSGTVCRIASIDDIEVSVGNCNTTDSEAELDLPDQVSICVDVVGETF